MAEIIRFPARRKPGKKRTAAGTTTAAVLAFERVIPSPDAAARLPLQAVSSPQ